MVSTLDADTVVIDGHGFGARSRIGVVPTTNVLTAVRHGRSVPRSALGKSRSESHVLEFRR